MSRKAAYQESLKQDILHQTLTLAGEEGWPGVSTRKIADRLQTSTTALYHYFGGKEAILEELQRDGFRQFSETMLAAVQSETKPKKQLKACSRAVLTFAREQPELYALMFNLDGAVCRNYGGHEPDAGLRAVQQVIAQLTDDDLESVFLHWFAMMQGFVAMDRRHDQPEERERVDQLVEAAVIRFIKGL